MKVLLYKCFNNVLTIKINNCNIESNYLGYRGSIMITINFIEVMTVVNIYWDCLVDSKTHDLNDNSNIQNFREGKVRWE